MAAQAIAARTSVWLENDDWSWPGTRREPVDLGPPAWVPAVPDRGEPSPAVAGAVSPDPVSVSVPPAVAAPRPAAPTVAPPRSAAPTVAPPAPGPAPAAPAGAALALSVAAATAAGAPPIVPSGLAASGPRAADAAAAGPVAPAVVARRFTIDPGVAVARPRRRRRRTRGGVLLQRLVACVALAAVFAATYEIAGHLQSVTHSAPDASAAARVRGAASPGPAAHPPAPLAPSGGAALAASASGLILLSRDPDGAALAKVRFVSPALGGPSSFLVYLPPGYRADGTERYPVLYVLHGDDQLADSVLQFGLTSTLDTVIDAGEIHPLIAVIPDGQQRTDNWRNRGATRYEDYVIEIQQLVDRILPTVAARSGRAIAGFSMGGYGAMHIALDHLDRFSVAESWLGFFDGLGGELHADAPQFAHLPLTAFAYGGASDPIADPAENAPFAAALRAAGATASSAVYPGGHDFGTLHAHLRHMLVLAGHSLSPTA